MGNGLYCMRMGLLYMGNGVQCICHRNGDYCMWNGVYCMCTLIQYGLNCTCMGMNLLYGDWDLLYGEWVSSSNFHTICCCK